MKKEDIVSLLVIGGIAVALVLGGIGISKSFLEQPQRAGFGNSPNIARTATSSTIQIGPQEIKTIFSANQNCANRLVSVPFGGATAMLSFDSRVTPSASVGHPVASSTIGKLPSSEYGCGAVRAYASASTTITRDEFVW